MWKPVIKDESLKTLIKEKLSEIFEVLKDIDDDNSSLLGGQPGIILFKSYYFKFVPAQSIDYEWNIQILYNYFANPKGLNYSSGLAGVLHTLNHLEKENFFDFEDDLKDFDYSIFDTYILGEDTLDYLHGNTGVVLSLIEQGNFNNNSEFISNWFKTIDRKKEPNEEELKWKIDFIIGDQTKEGYCLGLAHGVPSVILILLKLYKKIPSQNIKSYITQSIHFLLNNKFEDLTDFYFPTRIIDSVKTKGMLAWCYGDLGVALALFRYSEHFNDLALRSLAIEIFMHHTKKHDVEFYNVRDADFCHGSAGIAHLYARMYNYTNIEEFRQTSEYWYKVTIEKAVYPDGLAGYKHSKGMGGGFINEYGLLEGISGIGLSFISAISDIEPKWDNTLLLS